MEADRPLEFADLLDEDSDPYVESLLEILPDISDIGKWKIVMAREGHPWSMVPPLRSLYDTLVAATDRPAPTPYESHADPLELLQAAIQGQDVYQELDAKTTELNSVVSAPSADMPVDMPVGDEVSQALRMILADEIISLAGSAALPARRRIEALEKVAVALANPTRENVRAILLALLKD